MTRWNRSIRSHRHPGPALPLHRRCSKTATQEAAWYSLWRRLRCWSSSISAACLRRAGAGAGGHRFALAGRLDGLVGCAAQPGEYHDPAAGHRHRRDQRHSHPQPVAEEQTPSILARSTGKAVLVSGLTSIAGFGSLILAQHRGIHSLGCVMTTGLATCMIAGLTVSAGAVEPPDAPQCPANPKQPGGPTETTQCRQCTIDTGSGGTEVKTSIATHSK